MIPFRLDESAQKGFSEFMGSQHINSQRQERQVVGAMGAGVMGARAAICAACATALRIRQAALFGVDAYVSLALNKDRNGNATPANPANPEMRQILVRNSTG